jgi:Holliday junction resolvase RusA-like endonuclease
VAVVDEDVGGCVTRVELTVFGKAETQGSKVGRHAGGHTWVTEGNGPKHQRHRAWRDAVAEEAQKWQHDHGVALIAEPVVVTLRFFMLKPASAPKRRRTWPKSGDSDKLARSVLDSLTHTIIVNDNLVVGLLVVKDYGDPPRVEIVLEVVPEGAAGIGVAHTFEAAS